jgi:hypothetical protein
MCFDDGEDDVELGVYAVKQSTVLIPTKKVSLLSCETNA